MTPEDKITEWANNNASLHFSKEFSPDQHYACVCSYIRGYNDCKNGVNEEYKETNAEKILFYQNHLKLLEDHRYRLDTAFYIKEKKTIDELIWRLKHYQDSAPQYSENQSQ